VKINNPPGCFSITIDWGDNGENVYYWSFDLDGSHSISARVAEALGLPTLIRKINPMNREDFQQYQYEAAMQLQLLSGYDPLTQEFAQKHGLPLIETFKPSPGVSDP